MKIGLGQGFIDPGLICTERTTPLKEERDALERWKHRFSDGQRFSALELGPACEAGTTISDEGQAVRGFQTFQYLSEEFQKHLALLFAYFGKLSGEFSEVYFHSFVGNGSAGRSQANHDTASIVRTVVPLHPSFLFYLVNPISDGA